MIEVWTFNEPVVYKKILVTPGFFCCFRFAGKAMYVEIIGFFIYRYQPCILMIAQLLQDPLFEAACFKMKDLLPVAGH